MSSYLLGFILGSICFVLAVGLDVLVPPRAGQGIALGVLRVACEHPLRTILALTLLWSALLERPERARDGQKDRDGLGTRAAAPYHGESSPRGRIGRRTASRAVAAFPEDHGAR